MRVVGYGICGKNEKRLEATLKEFQRLCDITVIGCNGTDTRGRNLIKKYGFQIVDDNREWGKEQWRIKEDLVKKYVAPLNPDLCVCLDMDEVFDKNFTRERLEALYKNPFEAFYFWIVNLWDDGYNRDRNFWNIRVWKFRPDLGLTWPHKNVHCGLAPEWTWGRAYYTPFILKHYGLKDKDDRDRKVVRYEKYDPKAHHMSREYYDSLSSSPRILPFDEDALHQEVVDYVENIKQKYNKISMKEKEELVYIKTKAGETVPVPKKKLDDYTRQGCEYVGEFKDIETQIDDILAEPVITEVIEEEPLIKPGFDHVDVDPNETIVEEYRCGQCDYVTNHKRSLRGHEMGKHGKALKRKGEGEKEEPKKGWPWGK